MARGWLAPDSQLGETETELIVYWHYMDPKWADELLTVVRWQGMEQHSRMGDPRFWDPELGEVIQNQVAGAAAGHLAD